MEAAGCRHSACANRNTRADADIYADVNRYINCAADGQTTTDCYSDHNP